MIRTTSAVLSPAGLLVFAAIALMLSLGSFARPVAAQDEATVEPTEPAGETTEAVEESDATTDEGEATEAVEEADESAATEEAGEESAEATDEESAEDVEPVEEPETAEDAGAESGDADAVEESDTGDAEPETADTADATSDEDAGAAATTTNDDAAMSNSETAQAEIQPALDRQEAPSSPSFGIHGYVDMHYNHFTGAGSPVADVHRFVFGFEGRLNDWITFVSEVELEHGLVLGNAASGELELEQAFLNFDLYDDEVSIATRLGVMIVPFGLVNQTHEPTEYWTVERGLYNTNLVPTTWWEIGVMIDGTMPGGFRWTVGLTSGLDGSAIQGSNGIRSGRQKLNAERFGGPSGAAFQGPMFVARLLWTSPFGLNLGFSHFTSRLDQGNPATPVSYAIGFATDFDLAVECISGLRFRGEFGLINIPQAGPLNASHGNGVALLNLGFYLEVGYDLFEPLNMTDAGSFVLFVRFDDVDNQNDMPNGTAPNPAFRRQELTLGFAYSPSPNVVLKVGFTDRTDDRNATAPNDSFDLGIGLQY